MVILYTLEILLYTIGSNYSTSWKNEKTLVGFLSFAVVAFLFCLGPVGANASELPSGTKSTSQVAPSLEKIDEEVETQDWFTVSTEYGTPAARGDVYYPGQAPIDAYRNNSTISEELNRTWTSSFGSKWTHTVDATIELSKLNSKIKAASGLEITRNYTYSVSVKKTLKPGKGVQIHKIYRKYEVPTYKVTKYSASMGGGTERVFTGNTIVYLAIGLVSTDY